MRVNTLTRWERGEHLPRGDYLETLLQVTGLPTDAVVRPRRFLAAHPDFLCDYTSPTLHRGRPRGEQGRPRATSAAPRSAGRPLTHGEGLCEMDLFYAIIPARLRRYV